MNPRTLALRALLALTLLALASLPAASDIASGDAVIILPMPSPGGTGVVYIPVVLCDVVVETDSGSGTLPADVTGPETQDPGTAEADRTDDPNPFPM